MENSVKLLLSLTVTLLCVRPAPSLLCEMSVESDQFCSMTSAVMAPSTMSCFMATVTGPPEEPFKMVVKGVAGAPLCTMQHTVQKTSYSYSSLSLLTIDYTCCGTDNCNSNNCNNNLNSDESDVANPDPPNPDVLCMPPNPCPDDLLKQLHLLANGSAFIPPTICDGHD